MLLTGQSKVQIPLRARGSTSSRSALGSIQPHIQWVPMLLLVGVSLNTHFNLVPRLRMIGATPLRPLYAYMAWTRKTLPLPFKFFPPFVSIMKPSQ
jgi:hypothetical protein